MVKDQKVRVFKSAVF